jgi:hypothetical protein
MKASQNPRRVWSNYHSSSLTASRGYLANAPSLIYYQMHPDGRSVLLLSDSFWRKLILDYLECLGRRLRYDTLDALRIPVVVDFASRPPEGVSPRHFTVG